MEVLVPSSAVEGGRRDLQQGIHWDTIRVINFLDEGIFFCVSVLPGCLTSASDGFGHVHVGVVVSVIVYTFLVLTLRMKKSLLERWRSRDSVEDSRGSSIAPTMISSSSILRPCQLTRVHSTQVSRVSLASESIRRKFLEMYRNGKKVIKVVVEKGSTCPICLEEMESGGRRVVACDTCKNPIHEMCFMMWKKRRSRTCVFYRARWKGIGDQDKYINLSAYVAEDENNYGVNVN
nr:mitogen-activated protein kinase kinase kinase 1 [Tanacetum cinerariifolium]